MKMANSKLKEELTKRYGAKEGMRIYLAIVPGILSDFKKMLIEASPDEVVRETYHFEDENAGVQVTGSKDAAGNMQMEAHLVSLGNK